MRTVKAWKESFYTFTLDEIIKVLGKHKGILFAKTYNITANGNFEGVNIPNLLESGDIDSDFSEEIKTLYNYRKKRTKLHLDDKHLASWNSIMAAALSMLYRVSHKNKYLEAARKAQVFIEEIYVRIPRCTQVSVMENILAMFFWMIMRFI